MLLRGIKTLKGQIKLLSGLHIGAGKDTVEIGGLDQPVIKNPITGAPYIPGSSLKGKMRSLLETAVFAAKNPATAKAVANGKPCGCGKKDCMICKMFGAHTPPSECDPELGPTRLIVRDSTLTDECQAQYESGRLPMEIKYENVIDRVKGSAEHPRPLERVPAGVSFKLDIGIKIYENDDPEALVKFLEQGLKLVQLDALGGCSSRGCGQVEFVELTLQDGDGVKKISLNDIEAF